MLLDHFVAERRPPLPASDGLLTRWAAQASEGCSWPHFREQRYGPRGIDRFDRGRESDGKVQHHFAAGPEAEDGWSRRRPGIGRWDLSRCSETADGFRCRQYIGHRSGNTGRQLRSVPRQSPAPIRARPPSYFESIRPSVSKRASSSGVQMWRTTNARSFTLQSPSPRARRGSWATSTEVRPSTFPAA